MIRKYDVGDKVGFGWINRRGEIHNGGVAEILRVNKFGHIYLDNDLIFDKTGANRGQTNYRLRLVPENKIKPMPDTKEWRNVDRALKIQGFITSNFNARGEFPVTEELKNILFDQLAEFEV